MTQTLPGDYYFAGGNVPPGSPSYVARDADEQLFQHLVEGKFCYVLTSRQMGKSSLMTRMLARLRHSNIVPAVLDLSGQGYQLTPEHWYRGLLDQLGKRLAIEDDMDDFCAANADLSPLQLWQSGLRDVALARMDRDLVIFVDEIDMVRRLNFSVDEFFASIRYCYNARSEDPIYNRVRFCLLGVATPAQLVREATMTPFNIGVPILLKDFSRAEAKSLEAGLPGTADQRISTMDRVIYWTNGQPYLTQRICLEIAATGIPCSSRDVDAIVRRLYIEDEVHGQDGHLLFIQQRVLDGGDDRRAEVLTLYRKILRRGNAPDDETVPAVSRLKLSGLTVADGGTLRVKNRIYQEIFNANWIDLNMPDAEARRQKTAYRQGALRAVSIGAAMYVALAGLTVWALRERTRAGIYLREAGTASKLAVQRLKDSDRAAYSLTMNLIQKEWESGGVQHALELLDSVKHSPYRGFEWGYWNSVCHEETMRLSGHTWSVQAVDVSRDGKLYATGCRDGNVRVYDSKTGELIVCVPGMVPELPGNHAGVTSVSFSPDGSRVAFGCDSVIGYVDVRTKKVSCIKDPHASTISAVTYSKDGKFVCVGMGYATLPGGYGVIRVAILYDAANWKPIRMFKTAKDTVSMKTVCFSPDGNRLATGSYDQYVRIWDVRTGNVIQEFHDPDNVITCVQYSPDGRYVVSGGKRPFVPEDQAGSIVFKPEHDSTVRIWDTKTGRMHTQLNGYLSTVKAVSYTPDGKSIITGGYDNSIRQWDSLTGNQQRILLGHSNPVVAIAVSTDGKKLLSGSTDNTARAWNLYAPANPAVIHWPGKPRIGSLALSPDGTSVAIALDNRQAMLDIVTGREAIQAPPQRVADGGLHPVAACRKLTDANDGWTEARAQDIQIGGVAWSKDNLHIALAGSAGFVYLWNRTTGPLVPLVHSPVMPGLISSIVVSPDGASALIADASIKHGSHAISHIALVRLTDGAILKQLELAVETYLCAAWAPDGKTIVVGCTDKAVHIVDTATFKETAVLTMHTDDVQCLSYSRDGRYVLSGAADNSICMWDMATRKLKQRFLGHHDNVNSVQFSPDGNRVLSSSDDGTVRVWDPENGQELLTLSGHTRAVRSAEFTPDGTRIVSAGWDKTVRVWSARPGDNAEGGDPPGGQR